MSQDDKKGNITLPRELVDDARDTIEALRELAGETTYADATLSRLDAALEAPRSAERAQEERVYAVDPYRGVVESNLTPASSARSTDPFQERVLGFVLACFGPEIAADKVERNHRFLEEALELVQAIGCTASEAHQLVDYVYGRPTGEPHLEAGGVMVTLAALCSANRLKMDQAGEDELTRVWGKVDVIREKQRKKPKHSPLPEVAPNSASRATDLLKEVRPYLDLIAPSVSKERPLVMVTTKCDAEALAKRIDAFIGEPS